MVDTSDEEEEDDNDDNDNNDNDNDEDNEKMEITKKWFKRITKNIFKQITMINIVSKMSNNCQICYNKNTNDLLKCKQCKNNVCDVCFANIIFNNQNFNNDYIDNKTKFTCPFCKYHNVFNTKINNYNTNDKLIKLLIKKSHDTNFDDEYKMR